MMHGGEEEKKGEKEGFLLDPEVEERKSRERRQQAPCPLLGSAEGCTGLSVAGVGCTGAAGGRGGGSLLSLPPPPLLGRRRERSSPCLAQQKPQPPDGARAAFCLPDVIGSQGKAGEGAANGDYAARGSGRMRFPSPLPAAGTGAKAKGGGENRSNRSSLSDWLGAGEERARKCARGGGDSVESHSFPQKAPAPATNSRGSLSGVSIGIAVGIARNGNSLGVVLLLF